MAAPTQRRHLRSAGGCGVRRILRPNGEVEGPGRRNPRRTRDIQADDVAKYVLMGQPIRCAAEDCKSVNDLPQVSDRVCAPPATIVRRKPQNHPSVRRLRCTPRCPEVLGGATARSGLLPQRRHPRPNQDRAQVSEEVAHAAAHRSRSRSSRTRPTDNQGASCLNMTSAST